MMGDSHHKGCKLNLTMRTSSLIITAIFFTILAESCSNSKENIVAYDDLKSEVFITNDSLRNPAYITVLKNDIVIINSSSADTLIDIYDVNGLHKASLFPKGNGPEEALWIKTVQPNGDDGFYASDLQKSCLYEISGLKDNSYRISTVFHHNNDNASDSMIMKGDMVKFKNGCVLVTNESNKGRFGVYAADGKIKDTFGEFPDKDIIGERLTDWANMQVYYPMLRGSADGTFAVSSDAYSDIRYFMTLEGDKISHKVFEDAYPNDLYPLEDGDKVVQCVFTPESYLYTQDIAVSNSYAYILYIGMKMKDMKETDFSKDTKLNGSKTVNVYDKEGNLVRVLNLDNWAVGVGVSPDDKYLYTITESSEDGRFLLRYEL